MSINDEVWVWVPLFSVNGFYATSFSFKAVHKAEFSGSAPVELNGLLYDIATVK